MAMLARNSSDCIERALKSVADADEIVVLDTGSTDDTIEIARRYTDKIYSAVWGENFAEARNTVQGYCSYSHILVLDTDDELLGGIEQLRHFDGEALALCIVADGGGENFRNIRVYRNDGTLRWKGAAHNYLSKDGRAIAPDDYSTVTIRYYKNRQKAADPDRTLRILKRWVEENPDDCSREMYYLAKEYHTRKWWREATKTYARYIKISTYESEKADACLLLAKCLVALARTDEARSAVMAALFINPDFGEALAMAGDMCPVEQRLKWKRFAALAGNNDVLFIRPDNRVKITIVSMPEFKWYGDDIAKGVRSITNNLTDMESVVDIVKIGRPAIEQRLKDSDIIHLNGFDALPEKVWGIPLPKVRIITSVLTDQSADWWLNKYDELLNTNNT